MKIPAVNDDHAEYHQALGVFIEMYASAERVVPILLWDVSGVDDDVGKAIWPSIRISVGISTIRRLYEVKGKPLPPLLDAALSHLAAITSIRDNILHYGTMSDEKGHQVNTELFAMSERQLVKFRVTRPLLNALSHDLRVIICRLVAHRTPPAPDYLREFEEAKRFAQTPFLYIPQTPKSKSPKSQKGAQSSKRRPPASPG